GWCGMEAIPHTSSDVDDQALSFPGCGRWVTRQEEGEQKTGPSSSRGTRGWRRLPISPVGTPPPIVQGQPGERGGPIKRESPPLVRKISATHACLQELAVAHLSHWPMGMVRMTAISWATVCRAVRTNRRRVTGFRSLDGPSI